MSVVRTEVKDGVGIVTFDAPDHRNALDVRGLRESYDAMIEMEDREDVGAVMLTGAGTQAFCSGFQLKEIPIGDPEVILSHFREAPLWWHQFIHRLIRIPKPVLAAVNGVAAGAGVGMTLAADMAVCSENASFFCAFQSLGIANDAGTSYTMAKVLGFRRATELMLTNRTLGAEEALEWGLVNRVYKEGEFQDKAMTLARELANGPTHLQAMAKERFHAGWRQSIEECTDYEIQNVRKSVAHPLFRERLEAFLAGKKTSAVAVSIPD